MKRLPGLPAVVLGLELAKPLKFTSWLRTLPNTASITTEKRPYVVATPSPSTTTLEPPQTSLCKSLDTCLQKHGAMEPFHTFFDQSLLDVGAVEPRAMDITSSVGPLQIPFPSDRITSRLEGYDLKPRIHTSASSDCVLAGVHHSVDHPTPPVCSQTSSFTIFPPLLSSKDEMVPFHSSFPNHLLSDPVDELHHTTNDIVPVLELHFLHTQIAPSHSHANQVAFHAPLSNSFTSTETYDLGPFDTVTCSKANGGRASPQPSTTTGESSLSLSNSPSSSRRSSWATSISTHVGDDDNDQSNLDHTKVTADTDQNADEIELIDEYQHYCQLIELGDPQNRRDRNFVPQQPVEDGYNDMATPEPATQAAGDLAVPVAFEACGDTASEDPKAPPMQFASDPQDELMQPEGVQLEAQSDIDSENNSIHPSTPAEAAAWAHSYCNADPESTKLKILTDDRGREYVLYHDCLHCVPIELAPEFIGMTQQEEDDGYGSATETSEAARDGAKLGTIPEEEDEG
ncbi:hypothetical protein LA080_006388 [Diaporthe eres]|uniref:Uncharacterized protein n=1 Tax=Diaporthe vaccinii TaxID=105482 RepID=A0ABR4EP53_9PEZI|nr:hypothetical protein LA080_006388 [Diaporthe eres]